MTLADSIIKYYRSPELLSAESAAEELRRPGLLGYLAGCLGLFAYLRMSSSVFPGLTAFILFVIITLLTEAMNAGLAHFFLNISGKKGSAASMFYIFGCSSFIYTFAIAAGIIDNFSATAGACVITVLAVWVFILRIKLIRRAYINVSAGRAFAAMLVPGIILHSLLWISLIYWIACSIWAMKMM